MNKKKRILIVTPHFPYPPNQGGLVRIYNLLKFLSPKYDLYLLSFIEHEEQTLYFLELKKFCREVYPVLRFHSPLPNLESLASLPQEATHFYTQFMVETLKKIVETQSIDLVQIEFILMANYVNFISGVPTIFTEHDTSNLSFERSIHYRELSETERFDNWQKLVKFEIEICRKFNKIIVLTEEDKEQLKSALPYETDISVIPTGVDTKYFQQLLRPRGATLQRNGKCSVRVYPCGTNNNLVYVGHYRHYPNKDAMLYFCEKIFPLIVEKVPEVKLYIVGSDPTSEILQLQNDTRIIVTGEVPDVRPYFEKADVFVAPLRIGGGIKGKLLEAMAMGIPVVANKLGAGGIEAKDGKGIIIAEKPEEFAEKTAELLKNRELREKIARNARKLVEEKYDWRVIVPKLSQIYEETISQSK